MTQDDSAWEPGWRTPAAIELGVSRRDFRGYAWNGRLIESLDDPMLPPEVRAKLEADPVARAEIEEYRKAGEWGRARREAKEREAWREAEEREE